LETAGRFNDGLKLVATAPSMFGFSSLDATFPAELFSSLSIWRKQDFSTMD
jgi:hypothetical protein